MEYGKKKILHHPPHCRRNRLSIISAQFVQILLCAVFDEAVGNAEAFYFWIIAIVGAKFEQRAAKSALEGVVFHGNDALVLQEDAVKKSLVERLDEPHIEMRRMDVLSGEYF